MGEGSMTHPPPETAGGDVGPGPAPSPPREDTPPGGSANQEREGPMKAKTASAYGYILTNQR